jgi:hypothetical protein
MKDDVFFNISKIIERDSKSTTYKFALLRGVIDIIQDNAPHIIYSNVKVRIPTGLLIEKWMLYYYPILESSIYIPQIHGLANLAFEKQFKKVISEYKDRGGFSAFYNDLKKKGIPEILHHDFIMLVNKIYDTITKMPMKYIGQSFSDNFYSIFKVEEKKTNRKTGIIDIGFLIQNFGTFSIPYPYWEAFQSLGSFINGQDSILFKWAEFSVNASGLKLSIEQVINEVLKNPITEKEINESKKIYKDILNEKGKVYCVWTGNEILKFEVDHLIPFSIWKNNDLWNLLPSTPKINNQKRDKIPSPVLIEKQKHLITNYWELIFNKHTNRFQKEFQLALLGSDTFNDWQQIGINRLQKSCEYLISKRGYEEWTIGG